MGGCCDTKPMEGALARSTKASSFRGPWSCSQRARTPLPLPVSPWISTGLSVAASFRASSSKVARGVLGGGVMQREFLFPRVRWRVRDLLNGYVASKSLLEHIDDYIVPPGLGNQSGSLGAIALAMQLDAKNKDPRL